MTCYTKKNQYLEKNIKKHHCKLIKELSKNFSVLTLWVFTLFFEESHKSTAKDIKIIEKNFSILPPRYQYILLNRRFSITPRKKLDELGNELNISRQRVKQLEHEALSLLAQSILKCADCYKKGFSWQKIINHSEEKFTQKVGAVNAKPINY